MSALRNSRGTRLPSPYLKRLFIREDAVLDQHYPFDLPWLTKDFLLEFDTPVTVLLGANGAGKSTLIEAVAAICGFDEAGGGMGYRPVDHSRAVDRSGASLATVLRASWLPKVTAGWFFRAESFFSVARYLDEAARDANAAPPDFLSFSHGEGFIRFFEERLSRQGLYLLDEPESALSPKRQIELLRLLHSIQVSGLAQIIMATHSPILMAVPGARLLEISHRGLADTELRQTEHFKLYRDFTEDPTEFVRQRCTTTDEERPQQGSQAPARGSANRTAGETGSAALRSPGDATQPALAVRPPISQESFQAHRICHEVDGRFMWRTLSMCRRGQAEENNRLKTGVGQRDFFGPTANHNGGRNMPCCFTGKM